MNSIEHSLLSVRDFGGKPDDYIKIHKFLDSSKAFYPNSKHRLLLHNNFGIWLAQEFFGEYIVNSENNPVSVRTIAERHIMQDCNGIVPSVDMWMKAIFNQEMHRWMTHVNKKDIEYLKKLKQ